MSRQSESTTYNCRIVKFHRKKQHFPSAKTKTKHYHLQVIGRVLHKVEQLSDGVSVECGPRAEDHQMQAARIGPCTRDTHAEIRHVDVDQGRKRRVSRKHGDVQHASLPETIKERRVGTIENKLSVGEQKISSPEGTLLHHGCLETFHQLESEGQLLDTIQKVYWPVVIHCVTEMCTTKLVQVLHHLHLHQKK